MRALLFNYTIGNTLFNISFFQLILDFFASKKLRAVTAAAASGRAPPIITLKKSKVSVREKYLLFVVVCDSERVSALKSAISQKCDDVAEKERAK